LVAVSGRLAEAIGIPVLAGPFLLAGVAYSAAGLLLWAMLRPDPLLLARALATVPTLQGSDAYTPAGPPVTGPDLGSGQRRGIWSPAVVSGAGILALTQFVMVAIMTMTPIHIQHYGHDLSATGVVIGAHIAAMFLPSPLSGWLVDRLGPRTIATTSAVTLTVAGLLAASAPSASVITLGLALILLGLGWNFGLVSGSTVITDAVPLALRARTQGTVDLVVAVAARVWRRRLRPSRLHDEFRTLALLGGVLALAVIPFAALGRPRPVLEAEPIRL
jgi:MFS family permease